MSSTWGTSEQGGGYYAVFLFLLNTWSLHTEYSVGAMLILLFTLYTLYSYAVCGK